MSTAPQGFDAGALERRYAVLDKLPEALFHAAATHLHGTLLERVEGLLQWHDALLRGQLPALDRLKWPDRSTATLLQSELSSLRLPHFCREEKSLVEALLLDIMEAVSTGLSRRKEWEAEILARLAEEERARRRKEAEVAVARRREEAKAETATRQEASVVPPIQASRRGRTSWPAAARRTPGAPASTGAGEGEGGSADAEPVKVEPPDAATLARLKAEAARLAAAQAEEYLGKQLRDAWKERARIWSELEDVFGELAMLLGRGWDFARGLLRSQGWLEVVRLRKLLERLPNLKELIRVLGRMGVSEDPSVPPVTERIVSSLRRVDEERRLARSPFARSETRGVERSGDLQRMLPSEAVLLGHPALRLLWHARRAERTLVTYRVEGLDVERVRTETQVEDAQERPRPAQTRGPILVCLDTSGSMQGTPEVVAKALVLEALRVAFAEKRSCYLYAFSGPGDVAEQELSMTEEGLARLMAFLTQSFYGGTDITMPLARAVARLDAQGWGRADLLLVSDGEFAVPPQTRDLLTRARTQKGLRAHGVLIGGDSGAAMASICSPVHRFTDWAAVLDPSRK